MKVFFICMHFDIGIKYLHLLLQSFKTVQIMNTLLSFNVTEEWIVAESIQGDIDHTDFSHT